MFQQLSDDDFSSQKALNGAIINDKAMIDNGNIALEKVDKKVIEANTDQDIKKINNILMDKHLETIAINNPKTIIIDAE
jgi:recombinational DNA repair protein (RecF pathway)